MRSHFISTFSRHDASLFPDVAGLVRHARTRVAVARNDRPLSYLDFGDHSPADARGAGLRLLFALCGALSHGRSAGRRNGRRGVAPLGRVGLLFAGAQSAYSGTTNCGAGRFSARLRRRAGTQRGGRLYGGGHLFVCLWAAHGGGGWECLSRAGALFCHRHAHRCGRRQERVCSTGRFTDGAREGGGLQPSDHGFRGGAVYAAGTALFDLSVGRNVCRPTDGAGGGLSREEQEGGRHAPLFHLHSARRHFGGGAGIAHSAPTFGRYLAGIVRTAAH